MHWDRTHVTQTLVPHDARRKLYSPTLADTALATLSREVHVMKRSDEAATTLAR